MDDISKLFASELAAADAYYEAKVAHLDAHGYCHCDKPVPVGLIVGLAGSLPTDPEADALLSRANRRRREAATFRKLEPK